MADAITDTADASANTAIAIADMQKAEVELIKLVKEARRRYWFWATAWVIIGLCAIIFPAFAATPLFDDQGSKIMAGVGSIFVGAFTFLQPEKRASEYHIHLFRYKAVLTDVVLGTLKTSKEISKRLNEAAPEPPGTFYLGPQKPNDT